METSYYLYNDKLWTPVSTESDNDNFFYSVFVFKDNKSKVYTDKYAKDRRRDWSHFLNSFEDTIMPPYLADILRKCLSANDKYKKVSIEDKEQFKKYVTDIATAEHPVTMRELPILAALNNIKIVVLSKNKPTCECIIEPNLEILDDRRRCSVYEKKETVLCLEGGNFCKLKTVVENLTSQVEDLTSYWIQNLKLDQAHETKCARYAMALLKRKSSWVKVCHNLRNHLVDAQLQATILRNAFQENYPLEGSLDWEGSNEFLQADRIEPKLPDEMNLMKLFDMYVEKKRKYFISNENSQDEFQTLRNRFEHCLNFHRILAIEMTFEETNCELFSTVQASRQDTEPDVLKVGIIEKLNNEFHFNHETFKPYFVAESILQELRFQNHRADFQKFLFEQILSSSKYSVIRALIDSGLQTAVDSLPSNIFQNYQSLKCDNDWSKTYLQCSVHLLAGEGCTAILRLLLKYLDIKTSKGKEISIMSIQDNDFDRNAWKHIFGNALNVLRYLLRYGGVNICDSQNTPLHYASNKGYAETVKFLIELGADVNSLGVDNETALHLAVSGGHLDTAKILVESGAEIKNKEGTTTLHSAVTGKDLDIVTYLVENNAKINVLNHECRTELHLVATEGQLDIVQILVEHSAKVDMRTINDPTALHLALFCNHTDIAKYLVNQGANVNIREYDDSAPLYLAVTEGNLDMLKFLLDHGADIDLVNNSKVTALHLAVPQKDYDIVNCLLLCGAKINTRNYQGFTPLHLAVQESELDLVKLLVEHGQMLMSGMVMALPHCIWRWKVNRMFSSFF